MLYSKVINRGVLLLFMLLISGCVAVRTSSSIKSDVRLENERTRFVQADVTGVEPLVTRIGKILEIKIQLLGNFDIEKTKIYSTPDSEETYISCGFFPGVMSCKGEYAYPDCVLNTAGAFFYNLVYGGLPTAYGLLMEPFIPYYTPQTDSIVQKFAFLKSPIIGFSRYSKFRGGRVENKVTHKELKKILLEDVEIVASDVDIKSERGSSLRVSPDVLPEDGFIRIKFILPEDHPLKSELSIDENIEITVYCAK